MSTNIEVNKPAAIAIDKPPKVYKRSYDIARTIAALDKGELILINEFYSDGVSLLKELHKYLKVTLPNKSYEEQQHYRSEYHRLSNFIVLEVVEQKLKVKKSPSVGWLAKLYPDNDHFYLTFPQIQGMNSAWQWYQNGVPMPVLRNKIHPYYGVYFPTRFEHLILFDNWLKRYEGPKKSAIEIGIGCGVMSFQLIRHQFQKVFATDVNPNAIVGLREFMGTTKLSRKIELDLGHLFGKWEKQSELIVFNPPWLPESRELSNLDEAIYYNKKLFPEFFAEAKTRLLPDGKLVLIFSNLAQISNVTKEHPIETELAKGKRFQLEKRLTRSVSAASSNTTRDQHWRASEEVELWILTHI